MNPGLHALLLTSIAIAAFTVVMAWCWTSSVERRLTALETSKASAPDSVGPGCDSDTRS